MVNLEYLSNGLIICNVCSIHLLDPFVTGTTTGYLYTLTACLYSRMSQTYLTPGLCSDLQLG